MFIIIYGKPSCPYCERAKQLCEDILTEPHTYRYIDIIKEGLSRDDLEAIVGKEIRTVPQIFDGEQYLGGFEALSGYLGYFKHRI